MKPYGKKRRALILVSLVLAALIRAPTLSAAAARPEHTDMVMALAFSPDGSKLFLTRDHDLILKSVATGETLRTFRGHLSVVLAIAVSRDGKTLLSSGSDGAVKLWSVETGRVTRELARGAPGGDSKYELSVNAVALSPDGRMAASGNNAGDVTLWDVSTGRAVRALHEKPRASIACVIFSPRGESLFTAGGSGRVVRWDVKSGREIMGFGDDRVSGIESLSVSADGRRVLTVTGLRIRLWDAAKGKELLTFSDILKEYYTPRCVAFTPDGGGAVSGDDSRVLLWDLKTGRMLKTLDEPPFSHVESIAVSPDGEFAAAGDINGNLRAWRLGTGEPLWQKARRGSAAEVR
jgi:WD40 repeat protein